MIRLSREQVRRVDQICIEEYGLPGIVLMENAARSAADVAMQMLSGTGGRVSILCGGGNNGGDGLAIARHLHNRGFHVEIAAAWLKPLKGDAAIHDRVVREMGLPIESLLLGEADRRTLDEQRSLLAGADLLIDALFGTGFQGPTAGPFRPLLSSLSTWCPSVLAVDLPSGLDCDTGEPTGDACVRATRTVTFVAEKLGFANPRSREFTGDVVIGDIGCPREVIDRVTRS